MRIGYADPPYIGCAYLYRDQPTYAGEVDHADLIARLNTEYDGWILHAAATTQSIRTIGPLIGDNVRWCSWVKPFAAFKRNMPIAYAWEPVLIKAARKPVVKPGMVYRDWISEPITMKRGLTGAKPERVCHWAFELAGAERDDELHDLFPGTGAVTRAWDSWRKQISLFERA